MVKKIIVYIFFLIVFQSVFAQSDTIVNDTQINKNDNSSVVLYPEVPAEYIGGKEAMHYFIQTHIVYPRDAERKEIQGKVYVYFEVDKSGNIEKARVIKSYHKLLDAEALRVVKLMPIWKPALNNNIKVRSRYLLPIIFSLPQ